MEHSLESLHTKEQTKLEILQEKFCSVFDEDKKPEVVELFKKITEEYQTENRFYHNFEHIEKLLSFLEGYEQEIVDRTGMELAAYFHDIVYNAKAEDNEEQSAQYAKSHLEQLDIPNEVINHVMALIRATAKHEIVEGDSDSAIFLDGDLAILGSDEEEYDKYAAKIRQEYAYVPDDKYRVGRTKVLESFLKKPRIYFTERANKKLEERARENIRKEIDRLS